MAPTEDVLGRLRPGARGGARRTVSALQPICGVPIWRDRFCRNDLRLVEVQVQFGVPPVATEVIEWRRKDRACYHWCRAHDSGTRKRSAVASRPVWSTVFFFLLLPPPPPACGWGCAARPPQGRAMPPFVIAQVSPPFVIAHPLPGCPAGSSGLPCPPQRHMEAVWQQSRLSSRHHQGTASSPAARKQRSI